MQVITTVAKLQLNQLEYENSVRSAGKYGNKREKKQKARENVNGSRRGKADWLC